MHHNRSVAVYRDHREVVFGLKKAVEHWSGEPGTGAMTRMLDPDAPALALREDGMALFQVADELHTAHRYNLPIRPPAATEPATGRPPVR